jgi:outer membrane receptor protein involved in Fe transport
MKFLNRMCTAIIVLEAVNTSALGESIIEELYVTATKRDTRAMDTGISLSVTAEEVLERESTTPLPILPLQWQGCRLLSAGLASQ